MGIANRYNRTNINWGIDTKGAPYAKASELDLTKEYPFLGCFISSDNGYGEGGVIITILDNKTTLVNVPASFVDDIHKIREDQEAIDQIKSGKLAFRVESFQSKYKRTGYIITLVDKE